MSERETRAALEAAQVELRAARATLDAPPNAELLRIEVGDPLDRLAQQRHELAARRTQLRTEIDANEASLARRVGELRRTPLPTISQRVRWAVAMGSAIVSGVLIGMQLQDEPSWVRVALGVGSSALAAWELLVLVKPR